MKIKLVLTFICSMIFAHEILGSGRGVTMGASTSPYIEHLKNSAPQGDLDNWLTVTTPAMIDHLARFPQAKIIPAGKEKMWASLAAHQSILEDEEDGLTPLLSVQAGDTEEQAQERYNNFLKVSDWRTERLFNAYVAAQAQRR